MSKNQLLKFLFSLIIPAFCIVNPIFSQSGCPNADFSMGDFTNWVGYTGTFTSCCPTQGIVNGRHTIITAQGTDPRTNNQLQLIPPGATVSAKLGNENVGYEAERLTYTINVTPQSNLFVYKYAVVLEDPGHSSSDQPKFNIRVLNSSGSLVDPVCGFYSVVSSGNIPGFQQAPGSIMWKNWTTVGIDLTAYIGQNVTVEYTTYDCNQGGHYGYAYLSCSCAPMEISVGYCQGSNNVVMEAPAGFASYSWSPGGYTTQTVTLNNPTIGATYTCVMTSVNGCQMTLNAVIQPTVISPAFSITSPQCSFDVTFQDSSSVNQGAITSWLWNFGDGTTSTQQNPSHTYTNPGNYTVTLTAGSAGCTANTSMPISVFPMPVANAGTDQIICIGQFANLTAVGGITYNWSNGVNTPNNNVNPAATTTYTVTVTDGNGCTALDSILVTVNPLPVANAGTDTSICNGNSTVFNASGCTTYLWAPASGLTSNTVANPTANPTVTTTYTVTVTDANGCKNTDNLILQIWPLPPADAGPDIPICNGDTALLNASGGTSYTWSTGDTGATVNVTPTTFTNYIVTVTDANGCSQVDDVNVTINNPPPASAGSDVDICNGSNTMLSASGGTSYAWWPATALSSSSIANPIANPTVATTYTVVVTDDAGCTATDDVVVGIFPSPALAFTADVFEGCEPLNVNFTDNTTPTIQSWEWNFGDPTSMSNTSTSQMPSHMFINPGTYTVMLSVVTTDGCAGSLTQTDMISVYPNPVADFIFNPIVGTIENPIIRFFDESYLPFKWLWNFGDPSSGNANTSTQQNPMHMYSNDGQYLVELIVETDHGCRDTTSKEVTIKPDFTFYVPNVFTPDGDGLNDYFQGYGTNISEYLMYIFNRWGEQLFETDDYNTPWDGIDPKSNNIYLQDVYVYKIIIKDINGKTHKYYGHITLLR